MLQEVPHEEQPDRPLADVRRLSGWLVVRDDRVWLERGPPTPYGQSQPAPGLPSWAKTLFGFLIRLPVSVLAPVLAFALVQLPGPVSLKVFLVTVIPPLLGVPLLFGKSTRPWGVGLMLGLALGSLVLGGTCVSIIDSSSGY